MLFASIIGDALAALGCLTVAFFMTVGGGAWLLFTTPQGKQLLAGLRKEQQ